MAAEACCTCSALLNTFDAKSEKAIVPDRYLPCCGRVVCTRCINQNPRYNTYCPYCQISTEPSSLPQGLRDPPSYDASPSKHDVLSEKAPPLDLDDDAPPAYSSHDTIQPPSEKEAPAPDVLHFITPTDSLHSLSLAYGVPLPALRKTNNVFADHLIKGRKTLLIPGEYYKGGVSLSPTPLESEEEEIRKNKIRRWMVACKCAEYDVAVMYLDQTDYDLDAAVQSYLDDEQWEKEHPLEKGKKVKTPRSVGMRRYVGGS